MNHPTRYVFSTTQVVRYCFPTHINDLVMDRAEAETSEAFLVVLEPGQAPPLHIHDDTEQIFFVQAGDGMLQVGSDEAEQYPVKPGDLVRIPAHTYHNIHCVGTRPLIYLSIDCFLNGRPAAEPTWESHVRVLCDQNGWDFDEVAPVNKKENGNHGRPSHEHD
jgi:mannose-6-phosphate isomerase-like protein (cupin superfamily)